MTGRGNIGGRVRAGLLSVLLAGSLSAGLLAPTMGRAASASAAPVSAAPIVSGCPIFPANNIWNTRIDTLPVHPNSAAWISSIGASTGLKADFGGGLYEGSPIGIPYVTVPGNQPAVSIEFEYADESDPGPYRIPPDALVEGGSDNHVLVVDRDTCTLAEVFDASKNSDTSWSGGSGAFFNLNSNALRPKDWTSADAAGLPILPGLVRYDEILAGEIAHALRFTAEKTQKAYVWPARHHASSNTDPNLPPMGARVRLKASVDVAGYPAEVQIILLALQRYGMFLADNGSNWFVSGTPDPRWNNDNLQQLRKVLGGNLEFVEASSLMVSEDSGEARTSATGAAAPVSAPPAAPAPAAAAAPPPAPKPQPAAAASAAPCDLQAERVVCPNANLAGADLSGLYLDSADLRGANLRGATLKTTILTQANLEGVDLTDANLDTATLTGARLTNATLVRTNFREADLADVDFTGATFNQTTCADGSVSNGPTC